VYVVGVEGRSCVLMDEMECFELGTFYVDIDVMREYAVDADCHVLSCFGGLFFLAFCGGSLIVFFFADLC
jgi:hypothetical protein